MPVTGKSPVGKAITVRLLKVEDWKLLEKVAPEVFDYAIDFGRTKEFLADSRHHLVVAFDNDLIVGMASAVHYIHPDKAPELWINEVGVSPAYQNQGIGRRLMDCLLEHAKTLGCKEAWVLTHWDNTPARLLYKSVGGKEEPERPVYFTIDLGAGQD